MSNRENNIDKLFSKKFEKFEVKPSEEEWLALSSKLGRFNFLKFSFITFNIYYLMVLAALAGTVAYSGVKNHELSTKVKYLEQRLCTNQSQVEKIINKPIESTPDVKATNKPEVINTHNINEEKLIPSSESKTKTEVPSFKKEENASVVTKDERKDTTNISSQSVLKPDSSASIRVRKIKKTLVVKPKTVILKKDTVVITKISK